MLGMMSSDLEGFKPTVSFRSRVVHRSDYGGRFFFFTYEEVIFMIP